MHHDIVKPAQTAPLPAPDQVTRSAMLQLERSEAIHQAAFDSLACLNRVEAPVGARLAPLDFPLTVAAWNLERCYAVEPSAALVATTGAQVVLVSEMDNGMARTGQRHTTRDMAGLLGMAYAYGVEFVELELGNGVELEFCVDDHNRNGFHGNGIVAATALQTPVVIRLPDQMFWFNNEVETARIGSRCAIAAVVATTEGPVCVVSVHLESRGDGAHRGHQMEVLLDTIETLVGDMPVVLGGDLNTGLADGGDFDKEPLFALAASRGFARHSGRLEQTTTRPSRVSRGAKGSYKLDWFLTRGVVVTGSEIIAAVAPDGEVLSDHEMVVLTVSGLSA